MLEVVAPSPQDGVEAAQQISERSMFVSPRQIPDLVGEGHKCLLRRPGVDVVLGRARF